MTQGKHRTRSAYLLTMSLGVNLSSKEILSAYLAVLNGEEPDWTVFTYEKASNDLKVQASGSGGLEELSEEFSDGRYASRVTLCVQMTHFRTQNSVCLC